ncbi:MAG: NAD(P)H-dependent oxidoreductase subunit E [Dehalococcoidia bacterium]|jgi:NADH-quinone oxidoreductase subunit E
MNNGKKGTQSTKSKRAELLPILKREAGRKGYLSRDVMSDVATRADVNLGEVYSVSTFYSYLPVSRKGKNIIKVCSCVPCDLKNAQGVISSIEKEIGIGPGETTVDGKFSLEIVNCIGACDHAPAMMINDELFGDLTQQKIAKIIKSI